MSVQCLAYSRCSLNVSFSYALKVQISIFSKILLLKLLGTQNSNPNPLLESHSVTTSSAYSRLQEIFFFPGNLKACSLDPRQHGTWPFLPGSLVSQSLLIRQASQPTARIGIAVVWWCTFFMWSRNWGYVRTLCCNLVMTWPPLPASSNLFGPSDSCTTVLAEYRNSSRRQTWVFLHLFF